ncbi:hypothetical protein MN116_004192 [Schistosoma mekongi]|uniref:SH3 domain-containing protein n=1 Tax=Schistosoma mekongi TaxID=38744 RepID=A0AAE1ZFP7_SCHME|nr:hypothetical protein MN116_004192 [Schistosoma mekongi]
MKLFKINQLTNCGKMYEIGDNTKSATTYRVQHLRTFEVAPKNMLPNTQTAVELLMKEFYTHVRSFNMSIDNNDSEPYLILRDPRNGNCEVERFRISHLLYPRYRSAPPNICPVNNLLTFTIKAGSMDNGRPNRNEIHLFQVLTCPAQTIVNALLRAGALDNDSHYHDINDSMLISRAPSEPNLRAPLQIRPAEIQLPLMVTKEDSVYSESQINREWIDKEVALLNYCFDDIEKELKLMKSRTSRQFGHSTPSITTSSKSKSRISSIAADQLSTFLPSEPDGPLKSAAVDFFQKLKFASILLARLEGYVVDPNSAVLMRQLFALLKYAVDVTRSPSTRKSQIARSTIHPRFPFHAILFIHSNLTQEYEKLWRNLGDAWNTPREEYPDENFVYIPYFDNGFMVNTEEYEPSLFNYSSPNVTDWQEMRYVILGDSAFSVNQSPKIQDDRKEIVQVTESFQAQSEKELTVEKGEWVKVLEKKGDWYKVKNKLDEEGHCPGSILTIQGTI